MPTSQGNIGVIRGVAVGSYGQTILITLKDFDGVAQNVSAYTGTRSAIALSPDGGKRVTATVSFSTDGTDGIISWTWAAGDIDRPGDWQVQIALNSGSARIKTYIAQMPVIPALAED